MRLGLDVAATLPADGTKGTLIGRAWVPGNPAGPAVVSLRGDAVWDITRIVPTVSELLNAKDSLGLARGTKGAAEIGKIKDLLANSDPDQQDANKPYFLAPCDLQAVKAAGVTFADSMLERVIESKAKGDPSRQEALRGELTREIGSDLSKVKPGTADAEKLKQALIARDLWSPYLEVGIGPYAEIFTKCPPMASVGTGAEIGLHPESSWNNPEPEIVLAVSAQGEVKGATLGNDVNLRDVEGRSALLLGKAKDNNASCAIGPFIRLFDAGYSIDDVRNADLDMTVTGEDGFVLEGRSSMALISRDPLDLVAQTIGRHHQYPDGLALFLGTSFAPIKDRDAPGAGFTHHLGDVVTIRSEKLGTLVNRVRLSTECAEWTFGISQFMRNLAGRNLL